MKDLQSQLRDADPLAHEAGLSRDDVARMRRHVLSAQRETAPGYRGVFFALAATLLLTSIGGILLTRASLPPPADNAAVVVVPEDRPLRQLQFSGPGGTRVIWTFNPNLQVR